MPLASNVNLDTIATTTSGWTGAELASLCQQAALQALRENMENENVTHNHFEQALQKRRNSA